MIKLLMTSEFNNKVNNFKKIEIIEKMLDTVLVSDKLTVFTSNQIKNCKRRYRPTRPTGSVFTGHKYNNSDFGVLPVKS